MTDRPIIFSGPMVRALLAGRKTQTRRLSSSPLAKSQPSDRLYVRESFRVNYDANWYREDLGRSPKPKEMDPATTGIEYLADGERQLGGQSYTSIHMPRWASRMTLLIEDVRIERLQAISRADAISEGIERVGGGMLRWENWSGAEGQSATSPEAAYALLWNSLHGTDEWEANPFVVAIAFRVECGNIDCMGSLK